MTYNYKIGDKIISKRSGFECMGIVKRVIMHITSQYPQYEIEPLKGSKVLFNFVAYESEIT